MCMHMHMCMHMYMCMCMCMYVRRTRDLHFTQSRAHAHAPAPAFCWRCMPTACTSKLLIENGHGSTPNTPVQHNTPVRHQQPSSVAPGAGRPESRSSVVGAGITELGKTAEAAEVGPGLREGRLADGGENAARRRHGAMPLMYECHI